MGPYSKEVVRDEPMAILLAILSGNSILRNCTPCPEVLRVHRDGPPI